MNQDNKFFAGQEEVFARICSMILSMLFFVIYVVASVSIVVDYKSVTIFLLVFWVIYESLSLILFQLFNHFSNLKVQKNNSKKINENELQEQEIDQKEL